MTNQAQMPTYETIIHNLEFLAADMSAKIPENKINSYDKAVRASQNCFRGVLSTWYVTTLSRLSVTANFFSDYYHFCDVERYTLETLNTMTIAVLHFNL